MAAAIGKLSESITASLLARLAKDDPKTAQQAAEPTSDSKPTTTAGNNKSTLSPQEQKLLSELQARDTEVRKHEAAHLAAASGIIRSGAHFNYQLGPDGKRYAVGGDVSIDTASVSGDPAATIHKAEQIRRAALAPANPSNQDLSVAAAAAQMLAQAQAELSSQRQPTSKISAYGSANDPHMIGVFINATA